jgi:D-arabinose 1-dehydrogenase-like Zn-dependent alcohol dehydrogenase
MHRLGGLGHLGVQFANKMGFHAVAIGRGQDKAALAGRFRDGRQALREIPRMPSIFVP